MPVRTEHFLSAEACIQSTTLYIEGSAQVINLETEEVLHESLPLSSSILVLGYTLDNADIRVTHETDLLSGTATMEKAS